MIKLFKFIQSRYFNELNFHRLIFFAAAFGVINEWYHTHDKINPVPFHFENLYLFFVIHTSCFVLSFTSDYFKRNSINLIYVTTYTSVIGLSIALYYNNYEINYAFRNLIIVFAFSLFFQKFKTLLYFLVVNILLNIIVLNLLENPQVNLLEYTWMMITISIIALVSSKIKFNATNAIISNEEKLKALFKNATDGVTIVDEFGTVLFQSESLVNLLGYEPWEIMGKSIFELVVPEEREIAISKLKELLPVPNSQLVISFKTIHKDGSIRIIECSGKNLLYDPNINGVLINARDITERLVYDKELLTLKNQFQSIMANSFDAILIFEPVYDSENHIFDFRCTINNDRSKTIFKSHSNKISGSLLTNLFKYSNRNNVILDDFKRVYETKQGLEKETFIESNTLRGWYYLAITSLENGVSIAIADINSRKTTELRLLESESQYKTLFQLNPKPMWVYDNKTFKFLEVNNAAITHYGYSRDEFLAMNIMDIRPDSDRKKLLEYIEKSNNEHTIQVPGLWKHIKKNGDEIFVEVHRTQIRVGEIDAKLAIIEDYTEKFESERKKEKADYIIRKQNSDLLKVDSRTISNEEDFELKLKDIIQFTAEVLEVERVGLWLFNEDNSALYSKVLYSTNDNTFIEENDLFIVNDYPIYFKSFNSERALVVDDITKDNRTLELVKYSNSTNVKALIDQPFRIKGKMVGIICVEHIGKSREWLSEEINFSITISELISKAFESLDRAKAENLLLVNEQKYRSLFSSSQDAIVVFDAETAEFVDANIAWTELTGFTLEETKKLTVFDVSAEKDLIVEEYKSKYKSILYNKKITFIFNKFNKIIPAEITQSEFELGGRKINFSVIRNVFERIEAEKAIDESKNKFELLFSKSNDAILIFDQYGIIIDCNESAEKLFGYPYNDLINRKSIEIAPEYQPDGVLSAEKSKKLFEENYTNENQLFNCQYKKSNNDLFIAEVSMSYFDHNGQKYAQAFIRDITQKLAIESQIHESEQKYRTLIENMQDGMFLIQDGIMKFANNALSKMLNLPVEEIHERHFSEFVHPDDLPYVAENYRKRLAGEPVENQYEFRLKTNTEKGNMAVNMTVSLLYYQDKQTALGILKNIEEAKKSQEIIKLTEQRFLSFMNNSPILAWIKDENLNYTFMNTAFQKSFNIKNFEVGMINDYDIMPPKLAEEYRTNDLIAIKESKVFRTNENSKEYDGSQKVSIVYKFPIKMETTTYVGGIAIDITDKINAEKALRMVNAELQAIFDAFPDLFFRLRNDTTIIDYKAGKDSLLYLEPSDFWGKKLLDIMPENITLKIKEGIEKLLATNITQTFEYELNINNESLSYEARLVKFNNLEILCIVRNITELKEKEVALAENEEKLNNILNSLQNIVWSYDIDNDKLIYVNPAAEKVYGIPIEEMYATEGQFWYTLLHPDDVSKTKNMYQEVFKNKLAVFEYRIIKKDGDIRWIRERASLIEDKAGKPTRMDGIAVDITEEIKTQELTRAKELAEQSAMLKQQFLANMSHEIRTPMNGIMGVTEMLAKTSLNFQQNELVDIIKNSADNLMVILNDVLDLSKLEAGKMELKNTVFNIHHSSKKIKGLFNPLAIKKNLAFNTLYDNDVPDYIKADENRMMQILSNLTGNAIKFTDEGSVNIKFSIENSTNENILVKVSVQDTGIGILEEDQKKLFETFSQLEYGNSRKFAGTGLGLSIVKRLAEMMGGTVGVESEYGVGSTFWFTFKAEKVNDAEIEQNILQSNETDMTNVTFNLNILLVEDKIINQKVAGMMLENLGCKVDMTENGKEALAAYKEGKYDLVLMDIQMPVMDGVEATKTLRKVYSNVCPIIGLSANSLEGDAEKYIAIGMDDYISKPITMQKLVEKLSKFFPYENKGTFEDKLKNIPIRDERQLASISSEKDVIYQLNSTFLRDLVEILPQMKKAVDDSDLSFLEETSHGIKGIAANIGALRIFEITSKLNTDLKTGNTSECEKLLALLEIETATFGEEIKK